MESDMNTQGHVDGAVTGAVRFTMQSEGLAVCAAAVLIYFRAGYSWQEFALLFLVPDLSMLGYLAGPRFGAFAYNAAHSYVGPAAVAIFGLATNAALLLPIALIWGAHIGFDRMLGFGLKYRTGFGHTHLGHFGRT
jgi:hypothetical protein